jgi:hypothetical protein
MPHIDRTEYKQSEPEDTGSLTTLEIAKQCPKCGSTGADAGQHSVATGPNSDIRPGTVAKIFMCMNGVCPWYRTTWVVQVNPDGTIPVAHRKEKQFPHSEANAQRARDLIAAVEKQAVLETEEGTEIRGNFR